MIDLWAEAQKIFTRYPPDRRRSALLPLLHLAQERDGYVTKGGIDEIAGLVGISSAEVRGVASYYHMLKLQPKGRRVVSVCHNMACTMLGAEGIVSSLEGHLGIAAGETTPDGWVTLERAECLAACDLAPMLQIDYNEMVGPLTSESVVQVIEGLRGDGIAPERAPEAEPPPLVDSIELTAEDRALLHEDDPGRATARDDEEWE